MLKLKHSLTQSMDMPCSVLEKSEMDQTRMELSSEKDMVREIL